MEILTEKVKGSKVTTTCTIDWSIKQLVGELNGNETIGEIEKMINIALDRFKMILPHDRGIYMLLYAEKKNPNSLKLLYIGTVKQEEHIKPEQVYGYQADYQRVIQKAMGKILYTKIGLLKNNTTDKKGGQIFEEIENCLIENHKPICNSLITDDLDNNPKLQIENVGNYVPLKYKC